MTATDRGTEVGAKVAATAADSWHPRSVVERALLFGTGLGIAVGERDLEIAVVRARPGRPSLAGALLVRDFRTRPAAEWGSEVAAFLAASKDRKLAATVSIPRAETIVRSVHLPGFRKRIFEPRLNCSSILCTPMAMKKSHGHFSGQRGLAFSRKERF